MLVLHCFLVELWVKSPKIPGQPLDIFWTGIIPLCTFSGHILQLWKVSLVLDHLFKKTCTYEVD